MSIIPKNPFILVDGSSYLFRAFHALPPLTTSKGLPTGAIYGVTNMLRKLVSEYKPTRMAVVFDSKEKNFRHALYEPYKANRTIMPDDLQQQIKPLHDIIKASGFRLIVIPGLEADDIIGSIARQAKSHGLFTLISTGDKDFAQLVDDETFLINTMSGDIFDRKKVIEKFEVPPELIVDYLTLIGDTVDNVPGIPKVGPKTAVKWLQSYETLQGVIDNALEIPGKVGENLRDTLDQLPLFKELVTIKADMPLDLKPEDLDISTPNYAELKTLFSELEFKTWLINLEAEIPANQHQTTTTSATGSTETLAENNIVPLQKTKVHYKTILEEKEFLRWLKRLEEASLFSIHTHTQIRNNRTCDLVGISFAINPFEAIYIPFLHDYVGAPIQLPREMVLEKLKPLLENEKHSKAGHNLKFDIEVLMKHKIILQGAKFDTMLESYVLDSTASRHDQNIIAARYLNVETTSFEEMAGKGAKQLDFNQLAVEQAGYYAAEMAEVNLRLHEQLWSLLQRLPQQLSIFEKIEMPLVSVLARMEDYGVLIDEKQLNKQSKELEKRLNVLETEIFAMAGREFNVNSPKQLQEILYQELKLPILEKTPTGQPSTAEAVLQELAENYPLPKQILEYRSLSKLKSTYTDKLPLQIDPKTGRVHTNYQQAITSTGRLSSTDPNLQNIPIRTLEGRKIRSAFIAPAGYKIVAADYSQIELRIMAHISQDHGLLNAFSLDDDIHVSTAAAVFGIDVKSVTPEQRRSAKAINFGLMYGMSTFGLGKQLGIDRHEAEKQVERYFACFPGVRTMMDKIRKQAFEQGFVETILGRRLYLPDVKASQMARRKAAERAAINAPMQGTNADVIKLSMIQLDEWINKNKIDMRMIMQVHDELVFEINENILDKAIPEIRRIMENAIKLSVHLHVDIGIGNNWDEAH